MPGPAASIKERFPISRCGAARTAPLVLGPCAKKRKGNAHQGFWSGNSWMRGGGEREKESQGV
eukprot:1149177-Pelagomonas_calceolata.AAC.2